VNAGSFRIYSGAGATRLFGAGIGLPTAVWEHVNYLSVFVDANRDRMAQGEEVLCAVTGSMAASGGVYFAPLGSVDIASGGTVELSVMLRLTGPPGDGDFQVSLSELQYAAIRDEGVVWYTPVMPTARGYTVRIVTAVAEGGSLGFARGEGLTVGSPSFFTGGTVPVNLSVAICGGVETVRVTELVYSHTGTLKPQQPHASSLRLLQDDGDGVNTPGKDIVLAGSFAFGSDGSITFRPETLYLFPGSRSWFLLEGVYPAGLTNGLFSRIDLDPSRCRIQGIEYTSTGLPRERTTGTPPAVYGAKVQGPTMYFGTPTAGGGGTGGDDTGTPDGTGGGGGGGCFVSTAAFGDMGHAAVLALTAWRDGVVYTSRIGMALVGMYYAWSPTVAGKCW
jgi:hypothetical protein